MKRLLTCAVVTIALTAGTAVPARAAESSKCSKATANKVAKRLKFGFQATPGQSRIGEVACGPFFGAGSRGMAASIAIPSCGFAIQWGVFRYRSGSWRLVMKRNNGAELLAVGGDIRERMYAMRNADSHCFPSVQRTRVWHWNGTRFKAGPWEVEPNPSNPASFLSADGTLWCGIGGQPETQARCYASGGDYSAELGTDGALTTCDPSLGYHCGQNWDTGAPVLRDGRTVEFKGLRCAAAAPAITCTVIATGKGFTIHAGGVGPVGT